MADVKCSVCGYDPGRAPFSVLSLARVRRSGPLFARPEMTVRPKAEWDQMEELVSLREENLRIQNAAWQTEKELEALRGQERVRQRAPRRSTAGRKPLAAKFRRNPAQKRHSLSLCALCPRRSGGETGHPAGLFRAA